MYHQAYCPPELSELIQSGLLVPVLPNGRVGGGRFPPYSVPMGLPMMHPMNGRHSSSNCGGEGPPQMRKLFIGGLSHETNDDALRAYFSQWGAVVDAIVIRDPGTKQSRGFGFVTFASIASAEAAMLERPHIIAGKAVDSKRAIPREQMTPMFPPPFFECDPAPGCKLMLSGIHWDYHTVESLRMYFDKFGSLDQIEILGNPRGLGFVVYEEKESADKCLSHNGGRHMINDRKVDARPFPRPAHTYWRRPRVHPLYEQMAAMSVDSREPHYDEDSSYGGTTTEDDCKSSENGSSSSALDTDSPSNTSQ